MTSIRAIHATIFFFSLSLLAKADQRTAIKLLPHQKKTLNYLLKHPKQKGLLIAHSMGSGKTFLSLAFGERFPNKKKIVIVPRFLKSNWKIQIEQFGIKNPSQYELLSLEEASRQVGKRGYRNCIVIIDEVHKMVERVKKSYTSQNHLYGKLYFSLWEADHILALTGTPIYSHPIDIAFILNLVSGKFLITFDKEIFRREYMQIIHNRSWLRGYFLESKLIDTIFPVLGMFASFSLLPTNMAVFGIMGFSSLLPWIRSKTPLNEYKLRHLSTPKLRPVTRRYVSFYEAPFKNSTDYPQKKIRYRNIHYSKPQAKLFYRFADEALTATELPYFLDDLVSSPDPRILKLNSSSIQTDLKNLRGSGRQIGNLTLEKNPSPKFEKIISEIESSRGQVVVYSNYDRWGIQQFAKSLDRHRMKGQYTLLHPMDSIETQIKKLKRYNERRIRILLVHPEITEGISLKGTEQLHILEPISNSALKKQVIGRVVRYKSHTHLPVNQRRVDVSIWVSQINQSSILPTRDSKLRREAYLEAFPEVNENLWSKGIIEVDQNYHRKDYSPDALTREEESHLNEDLDQLALLLRNHSIENL